MIKVFLVEDEFVIREGIKKAVDWSGNGYEFCGEAPDGEVALPLIKKMKPDIVITDIRMPFMNGLELSKLIKQEMPWIEIIIISGFEEFSFAKEAIKLGVAQYLTKPVTGEDLLKELDSLSAKIEDSKREQEIRQKYIKEMRENRISERKLFFEKMITGTVSATELIEDAERLELNILSVYYCIMLVNTTVTAHSSDEFSKRLVLIDEEIENEINEDYIIAFDRDFEGKAFLFKADSVEEINRQIDNTISVLKRIFSAHEGIRYFGGIGESVDRLRDVPRSFESACKAYTKRYFTSENEFIRSADISQKDISTEGFDVEKIQLGQFDRTKMKEFLKFGDGAETEYFVEEYLKAFGPNAIKSQMFRQYMVMDIYFSVAEFIDSLEISKEEHYLSGFKPDIVRTEEESVSYIVSVIKKGIEIRDGKSSGKNNDIVESIVKYIEENYADEELSLNTLASHVNFSPNHLSMVFSQQTGSTLIKYITDFRMNKAKELLKCTNKKNNEISLMIGYKDPHYFSYLFKKTQGVTPTQFREG